MEPRLSDREACSPGHQQEIQARGSEVGSGEGTAYYQQLDALRSLRQQVRRELLGESR